MGMTSSAVSRRLSPISTSVTSDSMALPRWLRMAPFGLPVVPEVYISVQGSSALTSTSGRASRAVAIRSS